MRAAAGRPWTRGCAVLQSCAGFVHTDCKQANSVAQATEDDWPPFCKVGLLDFPGSIPSLACGGAALQAHSAAGRWGRHYSRGAGSGAKRRASEQVSAWPVYVLQDREGITCKGPERLSPRSGLVPCLTPASVSAITLHAEGASRPYAPVTGLAPSTTDARALC